jgi:hypothetical protein
VEFARDGQRLLEEVLLDQECSQVDYATA